MDGHPIRFDSKQEERCWRVLNEFKEKRYISNFYYQWPVLGYYDLRGAIILDFLVFNPMDTAVQIHGTYWHRGQLGNEDELKLSILKSHYSVVDTFWENELRTIEDVRKNFRYWLVDNAGTPKD